MLLPPWAHELNPDEITIIVILGYVSAMEGWRTIAGLASTISKNQYILKMFRKLKNKASHLSLPFPLCYSHTPPPPADQLLAAVTATFAILGDELGGFQV